MMTNFSFPYFSTSISEFWQRWHISLSSWFRDYVYIPLGGNRVSNARRRFNVITTFLLSGLWHGANWTFVLWGGIHGLGVMISKRVLSIKKTFVSRAIACLYTMMFVVVGWIFFRANTVSDLWILITKLVKVQKSQIGWYLYGDYKW